MAGCRNQQLLLAQLRMGGAGGVNDEGLHIRHIGKQREDFKPVDEGFGLVRAALYLEGEDGATAARKVFLIQGYGRDCRQQG